MSKWVDVEARTLLDEAETIAREKFGKETDKITPEIVTAIFQGLTALQQAKAMEQLGENICKAAAHAVGE